MAKLSLKMAKISAAVDLVPVSTRQLVEHAVAHAIGQGLDSVMKCCKEFETKYADKKYDQDCLCALKLPQKKAQLKIDGQAKYAAEFSTILVKLLQFEFR